MLCLKVMNMKIIVIFALLAIPAALVAAPMGPTPVALPSFSEALRAPLPVSFPLELPPVQSPLPLPAGIELSVRPVRHLDWSFLLGDGSAPAVVKLSPAPKPMPPSGAAAELIFAADEKPFADILSELFDAAHSRFSAAVAP